jgi:hypothetical protein
VQVLLLVRYDDALHVHVLCKVITQTILNPCVVNPFFNACIEISYCLWSSIVMLGCFDSCAVHIAILGLLKTVYF